MQIGGITQRWEHFEAFKYGTRRWKSSDAAVIIVLFLEVSYTEYFERFVLPALQHRELGTRTTKISWESASDLPSYVKPWNIKMEAEVHLLEDLDTRVPVNKFHVFRRITLFEARWIDIH